MRPFISMKAGQDPVIASYVARAQHTDVPSWGRYNVLAFYDTRGLKVGLVYNHFNWPTISMHIAVRPRSLWAHPALLFHVFAYPFLQLKCERVTAPVAADNEACINTCLGVGFQHEGTLRRADPRGVDVLIFGMLKAECRWLNYKEKHEEPLQVPAPEAAGVH